MTGGREGGREGSTRASSVWRLRPLPFASTTTWRLGAQVPLTSWQRLCQPPRAIGVTGCEDFNIMYKCILQDFTTRLNNYIKLYRIRHSLGAVCLRHYILHSRVRVSVLTPLRKTSLDGHGAVAIVRVPSLAFRVLRFRALRLPKMLLKWSLCPR